MFLNGDMNGQGNYIFKGGNKYVGEFKNDDFHGQGTFYVTTGEFYSGEWDDGKRNGQGILTSIMATGMRGRF